jgi:hypothetical protein
MMMMKSSFPSHECTNGSATVCALVQTCVGILIPGFKTRIRWCFVPPCAETENSVMANVEWQSEVVRSDLPRQQFRSTSYTEDKIDTARHCFQLSSVRRGQFRASLHQSFGLC